MLTYSLEERGDLPLYDYLSRRIKEDIWAGVLKPGEKLPSKRALARNLEVSVVTVENAYAQLVAEGYLYTREKSGYFVSALETGARPAPARTMLLPEEPGGGVAAGSAQRRFGYRRVSLCGMGTSSPPGHLG